MRTGIHQGGGKDAVSNRGASPGTGRQRGDATACTASPKFQWIYSERTIPMRKLIMIVIALFPLTGVALWAQDSGQPAAPTQDAAQLRQQIDELKQTVAAMEKRLDAQEKAQSSAAE